MPVDTNGVLDRCSECGERAEIQEPFVQCSECANAVAYKGNHVDAMVTWNKAQRKVRIEPEPMDSWEAQDEGLLRLGWNGGRRVDGYRVVLGNGRVTWQPSNDGIPDEV